MDIIGNFIGSMILEHLGAGFKWGIQFLIVPFTQKRHKTYKMILNGHKNSNHLDSISLGFSNILAGFFVIGIFIVIILLWD